jgi:hypothetical protein
MDKKIIPFVAVGVLIIVGIFAYVLINSNDIVDHEFSSVSIVTFSDENTSVTITRNSLDKTAKVNMEVYMPSQDLSNEEFGLDMSELIVSFATKMICKTMPLALFNQSVFENVTEEWDSMEGVISDETGNVIGKLEGNPLEGYKVTQFSYYLKDKDSKEVLSECVAKGPEAKDIVMKIDGKVVSLDEE